MNKPIPNVPRSVNDRELMLFLQALKDQATHIPVNKKIPTKETDLTFFRKALLKDIEKLIDDKIAAHIATYHPQ